MCVANAAATSTTRVPTVSTCVMRSALRNRQAMPASSPARASTNPARCSTAIAVLSSVGCSQKSAPNKISTFCTASLTCSAHDGDRDVTDAPPARASGSRPPL